LSPKALGTTLIAATAGLVLGACQQASQDALAGTSVVRPPTQTLKDFEMNDVSNGAKTMTLQSIEGRIFDALHVADVDKPFLFFYKNGAVSSRLWAPAGRIQMETHDVEAWGGVTVVSADSSTLTTEKLRYDPRVRKIFSDKPVHLDKPDSITDGIGLETDPELQKVKIGHQIVHFKKGMAK
jgi:LPS export ABC transporter protein LptC